MTLEARPKRIGLKPVFFACFSFVAAAHPKRIGLKPAFFNTFCCFFVNFPAKSVPFCPFLLPLHAISCWAWPDFPFFAALPDIFVWSRGAPCKFWLLFSSSQKATTGSQGPQKAPRRLTEVSQKDPRRFRGSPTRPTNAPTNAPTNVPRRFPEGSQKAPRRSKKAPRASKNVPRKKLPEGSPGSFRAALKRLRGSKRILGLKGF